MYLHRVSQLGMLDEPRAGWDVGAEPEEGAWWTYPEDGKDLANVVKLTLTQCGILGKPRSILSLPYFYKYLEYLLLLVMY